MTSNIRGILIQRVPFTKTKCVICHSVIAVTDAEVRAKESTYKTVLCDNCYNKPDDEEVLFGVAITIAED